MRHDRSSLPPFDAVSHDVGGVRVMPDRRMVSRALFRVGVRHDPRAGGASGGRVSERFRHPT
jgi:hypothetical protein